MSKIEFSVGAKAARLIGRENIADVDGALMELIKNAYDADAECVLVRFSVPFPEIPQKTTLSYLNENMSVEDMEKVIEIYDDDGNGNLERKIDDEALSENDKVSIETLFAKYNKIIIADNGQGMNYETITSSWMYIGTSDKETNYISQKGRIKTGAKGIGRFALDKLSKKSQMITKADDETKPIYWQMNWEQFSSAKLISDVEADIEVVEKKYLDVVIDCFPNQKKIISKYNWDTGTAIVLTPTREVWNNRLFKKVNTNLGSINPIGSKDRFDVFVKNDYFPEFNHESKDTSIQSKDFDYRIKVHYDGENSICIKLLRNEVDLTKKSVVIEKNGRSVEKNLDKNFWNRTKFQVKLHHKEDYDKEISLEYAIKDFLKDDSIDKIHRIGEVDAELYFLRIDSKDKGPSIMKKVAKASRSKLRKNFSGVKIYRDSFKVRPYGDEGALVDWLGLGERSQKSPAGVGHGTGTWRVEPYQLLGWVSIGRETNPLLEDMANREGLALNEYYYIFRDMIVKSIEEFEYDRQYVYREFSKWVKEVEDSLSPLQEAVKEEANRRANIPKSEINADESQEEINSKFSEDDLYDTIHNLVKDNEKKLNKDQILQILSSSGIVLNTFFHEFNAINTQFHVEAPQLRSRVNYILQGEEYSGLSAYNPYTRLDVLEKNDKLTAAFLDVVMEGLKKEKLRQSKVNLELEIESIVTSWKLILNEKHIELNASYRYDTDENLLWNFAPVDLYIILNNFFLNSAWFLEREYNPERKIDVNVHFDVNSISMKLINNGPELDERYKYNPDKIFELGETSKTAQKGDQQISSGTGLGLWILRETVERYQGEVHVMTPMKDSFGISIYIRR